MLCDVTRAGGGKRPRAVFAVLGFSALLISGCTGEGGEGTGASIVLPRDAAPHEYRTEWWYYTGHLTDGEREWGFQVTIFQFLLDPLAIYLCHVAVIDHGAGVHYHLDSMDAVPTTWTSAPAEVQVKSCRFQLGGDGHDHVVGVIPDGEERDGHPGEWAIELDLDPLKDVVFHGGDGIIDMSGAGGQSWYYSYTRLAAVGALTTPDGRREVTGQAWMDHQWGDFDVNQFQGWDWWSMQLEDGWEVMLFQFRDWSGELVSQAGTLVGPDGDATELSSFDDFVVTSLRSWTSPHTDGVYPLDWDVAITPASWDLEVRTAIDDQEMYNPAQNYWEGPVSIRGVRGGARVEGVGFVELTGYASDPLDP